MTNNGHPLVAPEITVASDGEAIALVIDTEDGRFSMQHESAWAILRLAFTMALVALWLVGYRAVRGLRRALGWWDES